MATERDVERMPEDPLALRLQTLFSDVGERLSPAPRLQFSGVDQSPKKDRRIALLAVPLTLALFGIAAGLVVSSIRSNETVFTSGREKLASPQARTIPKLGPTNSAGSTFAVGANLDISTANQPWASFHTFGYQLGEIGDLVFPAFIDSRRSKPAVRVLDPGLPTLPRFVGRAGDAMQIRKNQVYRNGELVWTREPNAGPPVADSLVHVVPAGAVALVPDDLFVVPIQTWWQIKALPLKVEVTRAIRLGTLTVSELDLFSEPSQQSKPYAAIDVATAVGFPAALIITDRREDFFQVELPETLSPVLPGTVLPTDKRAWVRSNDVSVLQTSDVIEIDVAKRKLTAVIGSERLTTDIAVPLVDVGSSPKGRFQIFAQRLALKPGGVFGPGELRLTAKSKTLKTYMGDDPYFIAIQGTDTPASIGKALTNGNFRLSNTVWLKLAKLPLGTLVIIR